MYNEVTSKKEYIGITVLNMLIIIAFVLLVTPFFLMSRYNVPSGDDWSYGYMVYHSLQDHKGIIAYFKSLIDTVKLCYSTWEPRWSIILLTALSPANFGEKYAHANAWIFISSIVFSQIFLFKRIYRLKGLAFRYMLPCILGLLAVEIMYVPYPTETFFWWTGAANYTFMFCLALVYCSLIVTLLRDDISITKRLFIMLVAAVLASLLSANNFFVMIPVLTVNVFLILWMIWQLLIKREQRSLTYYISLCLPIICFAVGFYFVLVSPGLKIQIDSRLGGQTSNHFLQAIFSTVWRAAGQVLIVWMDFKTICLLFLFFPFIYISVGKSDQKFSYPVFASIFSFGLFASMISVEMYTRNSIGTPYGIDVWFYAYYLLLLFNEIYWVGWMVKRTRFPEIVSKARKKLPSYSGLVWCMGWGMAVFLVAYCKDLKILSGYQAYNYVNNGWSQQYAEEWNRRLDIFHDPAVKNPVFEKISVYGGYITVYDFYEEGTIEYWINTAAARYYNKESVNIRASE